MTNEKNNQLRESALKMERADTEAQEKNKKYSKKEQRIGTWLISFLKKRRNENGEVAKLAQSKNPIEDEHLLPKDLIVDQGDLEELVNFERLSANDEFKIDFYVLLLIAKKEVRNQIKIDKNSNAKNSVYQELIDKLKTTPYLEKFTHIYQTEGGSWYFVIGKDTFRFKAISRDNNFHYEPQMFTNETVFTTVDEAERFHTEVQKRQLNQKSLEGVEVQNIGYKIGSTPLELGAQKISRHGYINTIFPTSTFQIGEKILTTITSTPISLDYSTEEKSEILRDEDVPDYHWGHAVSLILK